MWTAASLYTGGTDTVSVVSTQTFDMSLTRVRFRQTIAGILSFFLAMSLHPDVQRRGREEILGQIGTERLPTLDDKPSLPYIEAIVKEVLRWNSIAPSGKPQTSPSNPLPTQTCPIIVSSRQALRIARTTRSYTKTTRFLPVLSTLAHCSQV